MLYYLVKFEVIWVLVRIRAPKSQKFSEKI
jgi:hypothetical protein